MKSSHDQVCRYLWAVLDINLVLSLSVVETSHSVGILYIQNFADSSVHLVSRYVNGTAVTIARPEQVLVPFILGTSLLQQPAYHWTDGQSPLSNTFS